MLNNRLEDLIYTYRSYKMKLLMKRLLLTIMLGVVSTALYFLYDRYTLIKKQDLSKNNSTKPKHIIKIEKKVIKPNIIKVKTPLKIDEEKILTNNSLQTLLLIENKQPTFESAIDLAKYYFKQDKYTNSSKWAVIASNREPSKEEPWLIYAKSKIKLNQKGMAKKALKIYLLKYHSQKVTNLLNSL